MDRLPSAAPLLPARTAALACALLLGGCALWQPPPAARPLPAAAGAPDARLRDASGAVIETLPFRLGVSSATVERMGRDQGCISRMGASLVTPPGPVEVYKMVCQDGKVVTAHCDLRQCRAM